MKIAVVGYGQMGHMIEEAAKRLGHEIAITVDTAAPDASVLVPAGDYAAAAAAVSVSGAEGVIEFSHPSAVLGNIEALLPLGLPMAVGTTGWSDKAGLVRAVAAECGGILVHSANFSIGVNLFYRIVEEAASLIAEFDEYDCAVWESHHTRKADSPSGTALDIARRILDRFPRKTEITAGNFSERPESCQLQVSSTRLGSVAGTHTVWFDSAADTIELTHTARSREGFANGAVRALARLADGLADGSFKRGCLYSMNDLF